jgi:hypothetical protein
MCLGSHQQSSPPPAPPVPAPAPANDAPVAPVLNDKTKDSTNANNLVAGQRRGVKSLTIDMNTGSGSGLAIPS